REHDAPPTPHPFPTRRSSDLKHELTAELAARHDERRRRDGGGAVHIDDGSARGRGECDEHGPAAMENVPNFNLELVPRMAARKRSEEHTSELQSLRHLVCRLL